MCETEAVQDPVPGQKAGEITRAERMARRLRRARLHYGHNQREAAAAIGVPTNTYQTWEQARRTPTVLAYRKAISRYIEKAPAEPQPEAF